MYHTPIVKNRFERSGFKPIKRKRDKEQALAVSLLVLHYLPHLPILALRCLTVFDMVF